MKTKAFQGTTKVLALHEGRFPSYITHDEAKCLCGSKLRSVRSSAKTINGVPERPQGFWFGQCLQKCGLGGFYDIQGDT